MVFTCNTMKNFYVTFGRPSPFANNYVLIEAENMDTARIYAFNSLGTKWAFIYGEEDYESAIRRFKLTQVGETVTGV